MAKIVRRSASIASAVAAVLLMPACGLKDDLYLPQEETPETATQTAPEQNQPAEGQDADEALPNEEEATEGADRETAPSP